MFQARHALAALALCGAAHAQVTHQVDLFPIVFSPSNLTIQVGDTVEWHWVAGNHNVISGPGFPDGIFNSGTPVEPPNVFSVTFDEAFLELNPVPGNVYQYYCEVHVDFGMVGNIEVVGAPPAVPGAASPRNGCLDLNPPESLLVLQGLPALGEPFVVGIQNPAETQALGSLTLLAVGFQPFPFFPCGAELPGFGMFGPGTSGELLLNPGTLLPLFPGPPLGPLGSPSPILLPIPPDPNLAGFELHAQGVIVDPFTPLPDQVEFGLTNALAFRIGTMPQPFALPGADLPIVAPQVQGFACQFYDDLTGQPLPLQFIEDPLLVQQFMNSFDVAGLNEGATLNQDETQTAYIRLDNGDHFRFEIGDIDQGQPGFSMFSDGLVPVTPQMHGTIEFSYGLSLFSSTKEKRKETATAGSTTWADEPLDPASTKVGAFEEIKLIVYQDNPGTSWNKKYAEALAMADGVEAFGCNGPNDLVNHLNKLKDKCKKVKTLVFNVHGGPGSFRLGPQDAPFNGPSRVGRHAGQVSRSSFGALIKPYLATGATIKMQSCQMAEDGGTNATDGEQSMQDLADGACATVEASDEDVEIKGSQASTEGAVKTATDGGASVTTTTPAPAGDLDPCD